MFNHLWNYWNVFHNTCIISHSHHQLSLLFFIVLNDSHLTWYKVLTHCGFSLHFLNDQRCWASLYLHPDHFYILFGKISIHVFCPLLKNWVIFLLLSCKSSLYMLTDRSLIYIFSKISSHSVIFVFVHNCIPST